MSLPASGHNLGSAKVSRAQTFPSYPSEQGEEHQQPLSLASSYAFSYGSGLVQWQPGAGHGQLSLEPPARTGEPLAPSAPTICRENWCQPAPAGAPPMREPGEAASPKQRLSLYLFILPFLLLICSERRGLGGWGEGGRGTRLCCKKVVEPNETVLVGVKVSAWPEKVPSGAPLQWRVWHWGPSFPPHQQDSLSSPTTSVGPCHSLEFPLDALKCHLLKMWHQCCEGRLQIRAGSPTALEGDWVFFEPGTNKYWSSSLICFAGNRVWCIKVRLLPGPALILNSWGTNSSLTRAIFTMPLRAVNIPMSSTV